MEQNGNKAQTDIEVIKNELKHINEGIIRIEEAHKHLVTKDEFKAHDRKDNMWITLMFVIVVGSIIKFLLVR